jgi:transposase, IS30 family
LPYQQLTQDLRYQIYAFLKAGFTQSRVAPEIGMHKATICRQLKPNRGGRGFRPKQAQQLAQSRRNAKENPKRIRAHTWELVESLLARDWSPEQISGTLKAQGQPTPRWGELFFQTPYCDEAAAMYDPSKERLRYQNYKMDLELARLFEARRASQAARL